MKVRVIPVHPPEYEVDPAYARGLRPLLACQGGPRHAAALAACGLSGDSWATLTDDDGTVLFDGWLSGSGRPRPGEPA